MGASAITVWIDGEATELPRAEALKAIADGRATADPPAEAPAKKVAKKAAKKAKARRETATEATGDVETATED